ncbi:hypothetical protein D915_003147 [Fasciola hepatica]|uniref:Uncharacterized protein n=1 Tax=Fasciola hepatica TaxID=6192 RepID=A0A4E0RE87_FASHE|nr:hypothetical protein D915_003147 [Fasciola hepatica]
MMNPFFIKAIGETNLLFFAGIPFIRCLPREYYTFEMIGIRHRPPGNAFHDRDGVLQISYNSCVDVW